jgi:signal transduction histidine kinase
LRWYVKQYAKRLNIEAKFEAHGLEERLPPELETALYRVAQEALTNVARHAQASRVQLCLERKGATIVAAIEDNGQGFDVARVISRKATVHGTGLLGMRERIALLGGHLDIHSQPGHGTRLSVKISLENGYAQDKNLIG